MPDTLTLLSPIGASAAKHVTPNGSKAPPQASLFRGASVELGSFSDLLATLGRLVGAPDWFIVRGSIAPGMNTASMYRSHKADYQGGPPSLVACAHHWLLLDLDKYRLDLPAADFAADPGRYAAEARATLPPAFRAAKAFWQATGSAGVKPGARLRLGFWLSRPQSDSDIKRWIASWDIPVDDSLYTPSQPHYTSAPIFDGVPDPVPAGLRWGCLDGATDTVEVSGAEGDTARSEARRALDKAARACAKAPEGERRTKLNTTAYHLAKMYPADELPDAEIKAALVAEAFAAGWLDAGAAEATLSAAIRDGRLKHEEEHTGWREQLARDKDDKNRSTQANVTLYLEHHEAFVGRFGHSVRTQAEVWVRSPDWAHRDRGAPVSTGDIAKIVEWFQERAQIDAREGWIRSGLAKCAAAHPWDPVQDYLEALPIWDGQQRAGTFFVRHLGVADTRLVRIQTEIWFAQLVRRAYATLESPVKADYMVLLIGAQGLGKSTVLQSLCPVEGAFISRLGDMSHKDALAAVGGAWIVELAEFTQRAADRDLFKAFTTTTVDKFRGAYRRDEVSVPRRCGIAITTNEGTPLTDPTGNRRFWPMTCTHGADLEAVRAEREQVWAEAVHLVAVGLAPFLSPELEAEAAQEQETHREENIFVSTLQAIAEGQPVVHGVTWEPGQNDGGRIRYLRTGQACVILNVRAENTRGASQVREAFKDAGWSDVRDGKKRAWYPPPKNGTERNDEAAN